MAPVGAFLAAATVSSCAGHPAFSAAVERAWHRQCPESQIDVKATRSYGSSRVYLLDACGEAIEVEERAAFGDFESPGDEGIRALHEHLEPDPAERLLADARFRAAQLCLTDLERELRGPDGEEFSTGAVRARVARCDVEARASVVALGASRDDGERKTYWFRAGARVFAGWLELSVPSCDHRTINHCTRPL